jgi:hypothetical protein
MMGPFSVTEIAGLFVLALLILALSRQMSSPPNKT